MFTRPLGCGVNDLVSNLTSQGAEEGRETTGHLWRE